jgi:site-specific DNA-cytosine methylase
MMRTAAHRPAMRRRRFAHDDYIAVDLFSGFGGLTRGIEMAGFTTIMAANHNVYKVEVHEANHPHAEHWIADLVDPESSDYHDVRDLPAGDLLVAGVSCVNHSHANTIKAYEQRGTLFDLEDPDFDARVTRSERDRATANCVLHYAERHHPKIILIECTTELTSWGPAIPGRPKVGDGSTFRWWLKQFTKLRPAYKYKILYLNSMFFGVPQSRNRLYIALWDERLPAPDLDHRPLSWCGRCEKVVEGVWTWKTGVPPTGRVCYGEQYNYRCPACRTEVFPPMTPSLNALDLSNLGTRIGDKPVKKHRDGSTGPMAAATMARADRCLQRFAEFPPVLMPAAALRDSEGHPWQPMAARGAEREAAALAGAVIAAHRHNGNGQHIARPMDTVTSTHEKALLLASTGVIMGAAGHTYEQPGSECRSRGLDQPLWTQSATNTTGLLTPPLALAVDNYQGAPRGAGEPLPTQVGSETLGLVTARILPNRTNGTSRSLGEPMETLVGSAGSGGLGLLSSGVVPYRKGTTPTVHGEPMPTVTAAQVPGLLTAAGSIKNNGPIEEAKYRAHPLSDPLGTVVSSAVTQGLLFSGWYKQNGSRPDETAPHPLSDPLGTLTARDTTALLTAEWRAALAELTLDDCYFRMMFPWEVGRGCGFDVDFPAHQGDFIVWGSARDQVDGFGNAVSPPVGAWIGMRLRAILDTSEAVA